MMKEKYSGEVIKEMINAALQETPDSNIIKTKTLDEIAEELGVYHQELEYQNKELQRIQGDLEIKNKHYKELFDRAPLGYVTYNQTGEIIEANQLFYRMFNLSGSAAGKRIERFISEDDQDAIYFHIKKVFKTKSRDTVYLKSFGEKKMFFRVESALLPEQESVMISAFVDVTIERMYEEKLKQAKKEAEEANLAKSNFLRNISHDLRTPIGAIRGFVQLIEMAEPDEDLTENLDIIKISCDNMLKLVNDLIDLAKIESGNMELDKEAFTIKSVVSNAVKTLSEKAASKNIELSLLFTGEIPEVVEGDANRLQSVLLNIIGNAVKFTERGSVKVLVSSEPYSDKYLCLKVQVRDTGIGISKTDQIQLFEPFKQFHKRDKDFGGSGLGLMISKKIIEAMDGGISVESDIGSGTTVTFTVYFEYPE